MIKKDIFEDGIYDLCICILIFKIDGAIRQIHPEGDAK